MKYKFTLFLLIYSFAGYSQMISDSLLQIISKEKSDSDKINKYSSLAGEYLYSKPDTSFILAQIGLTFAKNVNDRKCEGRCLVVLANVYRVTGDLLKSLECSYGALNIGREINSYDLSAGAYTNLAIVYSDQGNESKSLEYTLRAKAIAELNHDDYRILLNTINIGDSYEIMDSLKKALLFTNEAYKLAIAYGDDELIGNCLNNFGNIYAKLLNPDLAIRYYDSCLLFLVKAKQFENICETHMGMAKLLMKSGKVAESIAHAKQSLAEAEKRGFTKRILEASVFLSSYYENHDIKTAFKYQKLIIKAKEILLNQTKQNAIQQVNIQHAIDEIEVARKEELKIEIKNRNKTMLKIGSILSFLLGILFLSVFNFKKYPGFIKSFVFVALLFLFEF